MAILMKSSIDNADRYFEEYCSKPVNWRLGKEFRLSAINNAVSLRSTALFLVKHMPEALQAGLSFDELGKVAFAVVDPGDLCLCIRPSSVLQQSFVLTLLLPMD